MRVAIVRSMPGESLSMDVYADGLVAGLRSVHPDWEVVELAPYLMIGRNSSWTNGLWKYYERFWHYPRAVAKKKVDVFHIIDHSYGHVARWLKRSKIPVVVTCHDLINLTYPKDLKVQARLPFVSMKAWQFSVKEMYQANHVIAVSSFTAIDIVKNLNMTLEQITVVPDGVDSVLRPLPQNEVKSFRQLHRVRPKTTCLLHVGSVHQRKNVFTILEVVKDLVDRELVVQFWKAGEDFTTDQKLFIKTHNLSSFITYLGRLDRDILAQVYNASNILLFPSLHEGFGMPVLEAMACGTPVITSNGSSLPEVAGDAAVLVNPTDVKAITEAVLQLRNDPAYCKSLTDRGLARVKSFTREAVAKQVSLVYEKVGQSKGKVRY